MSLIPYSEISSFMSIADNTAKMLANRSMQNRTNRAMRDHQLLLLHTELEKIETIMRMYAVDDLVRTAFDQLSRTVDRFNDVCKHNPMLAESCNQLLQMEAQCFYTEIRTFSDRSCNHSRRFLP